MAPRSQRNSRLLHSVVVLGVSLGGCGGKTATRRPSPSPASTDTETAPSASSTVADTATVASTTAPTSTATAPVGSPDAPFVASDCAHPAQFFCDPVDAAACHCDLSAPLSMSDCASPLEFSCNGELLSPSSLVRQGVGCQCDPERAELLLALCTPVSDLRCDSADVMLDECHCVVGSPAAEADCSGGPGSLSCQSRNPVFGCRCIARIR